MAPRSIRALSRGVALVTLVSGFAGGCSSAPPGRKPRPLVLVGVDAADWLALEPLLAAKSLPTFARLRQMGRIGTLLSEPPLVSPIVWTTIATGRRPEDHGVLDFMVDLPGGGQAPVGSASRRVPALWTLFSGAGRRVAVVGWWATWPAETVRGTIVTDRLAPQLMKTGTGEALDAIEPPEARERLSPLLVRPSAITASELREHLPLSDGELQAARVALESPGRFYDDPVAHLSAVVAATRSYAAIAEAILIRDRPDLLAVYFEAVDTLSHRFIRDARGPAAIASAYRDIDAALLRIAAAAAPESWILLCSDHGFQGADAGLKEDPAQLSGPATAWHRPYGIVAAIEASALAGAGSMSGARLASLVTSLDVAPTLLHAAGLPVGDRMPGHVVEQLLPPEAAGRSPVRATYAESGPATATAETADPDAVARLKALGYLGSGASTPLARQNLGEILYRRGRLPAAERELSAVTASQPENLSAWLWLARARADQKKDADALRAYRAALALPGGEAAVVAAVEVALAAEGPRASARLLEALPASQRSAPAAHVARALIDRAEGREAAARRRLRAALDSDPLSVDALSRLLGLTPRDDLPRFQKAAAKAPGSPRHLALYGAALLAASRPEEAETPLRRALALAPDGDAVRVQLARAQIQRGMPQPALVTLVPAQPSVEVATLRGAAHSRLAQWAEAASAYREALALAGTPSAELLNGLAWAELKQGRRDEARALLDRSLGLKPEQPEIRTLRGTLEGRT